MPNWRGNDSSLESITGCGCAKLGRLSFGTFHCARKTPIPQLAVCATSMRNTVLFDGKHVLACCSFFIHKHKRTTGNTDKHTNIHSHRRTPFRWNEQLCCVGAMLCRRRVQRSKVLCLALNGLTDFLLRTFSIDLMTSFPRVVAAALAFCQNCVNKLHQVGCIDGYGVRLTYIRHVQDVHEQILLDHVMICETQTFTLTSTRICADDIGTQVGCFCAVTLQIPNRVSAHNTNNVNISQTIFPLFQGARLVVDITNGMPRFSAAVEDGVVCSKARDDKERKYTELSQGVRCRLVVVAVETGGPWSFEAICLWPVWQQPAQGMLHLSFAAQLSWSGEENVYEWWQSHVHALSRLRWSRGRHFHMLWLGWTGLCLIWQTSFTRSEAHTSLIFTKKKKGNPTSRTLCCRLHVKDFYPMIL